MAETKYITMQANFDGLIRLLADGLYSTSDIFIRELIQNGHDSIIRRMEHGESSYHGEIAVTYDTTAKSITFTDNGIGMNEQDIIDFLSTIGSTGTGKSRHELEAALSENLIGQFGIGMLSSFLVASKVRVHTRKLGCSQAYEWINTGSTQCQLTKIDQQQTGTSVTVFLRPDFTYLLDQKKLAEIITCYCDFITVPISIQGLGPINSIYAPWDKNYLTKEEEMDAYSSFVNRRFPDSSMDVFPVKIDVLENDIHYRAQGVLYISNQHLAGLNSTGTLDIFVRKMLVKEGDSTLLPTWAKFIRGVVDSPDLSPTAGRDNITQKGKAFQIIQKALGKCIIDRLAYLAQHRPDKFAYINQWHHDHLKGMAMVNEEFFNQVAELLLFETNRGDLSLRQYLPMNALQEGNRAPIYYFSHYDGAAQYYRMAEQRGLVVINAGRNYDEELLEKYGRRHPEVILEKLNVLDTGILFDELTEEQRQPYRLLEQRLSFHLNTDLRLNAVINTKVFGPAEVPAIIVETEIDKTHRELHHLLNMPAFRENFGDAFRSLQDTFRSRPIQFTLNAANPMIQRLATLPPQLLQAAEISAMMTLLYNNALLYSHRLDEKNMSIVHDGIVAMMTNMLGYLGENINLSQQVRQMREDLRGSKQAVMRPDHIQLFMIAPFADEYRAVEQAVRQIFECPPFCFEVRMARDHYAADTLVENVKQHLATAHGFVAEISEQNANVMMEVGGILMSDDPRPVFALEYPTNKKRPADFGDKLVFHYSTVQASPEVIAEEVRRRLISNGRICNQRLTELMKQRKKLYLSDILLDKYGRFNPEERKKIMRNFHTVEELLQADDALLEKTGVDTYLLKALRNELHKVLEECSGYVET